MLVALLACSYHAYDTERTVQVLQVVLEVLRTIVVESVWSVKEVSRVSRVSRVSQSVVSSPPIIKSTCKPVQTVLLASSTHYCIRAVLSREAFRMIATSRIMRRTLNPSLASMHHSMMLLQYPTQR
jgi:hypothetical protein